MKSLIADCACGRGKAEVVDRDGFAIRCSYCKLMLGQRNFTIPMTEDKIIGMWNARAVDSPFTRDCKHCINADWRECRSCAWGGFHDWEGEAWFDKEPHYTRITTYKGRWIDRLGKICAEEEQLEYDARMKVLSQYQEGYVKALIDLRHEEGEKMTQEVKRILENDDNSIPIVCRPYSEKESEDKSRLVHRILELGDESDPELWEFRRAFEKKYGETVEESLDNDLKETENRLGIKVRWNNEKKEFEMVEKDDHEDD